MDERICTRSTALFKVCSLKCSRAPAALQVCLVHTCHFPHSPPRVLGIWWFWASGLLLAVWLLLFFFICCSPEPADGLASVVKKPVDTSPRATTAAPTHKPEKHVVVQSEISGASSLAMVLFVHSFTFALFISRVGFVLLPCSQTCN